MGAVCLHHSLLLHAQALCSCPDSFPTLRCMPSSAPRDRTPPAGPCQPALPTHSSPRIGPASWTEQSETKEAQVSLQGAQLASLPLEQLGSSLAQVGICWAAVQHPRENTIFCSPPNPFLVGLVPEWQGRVGPLKQGFLRGLLGADSRITGQTPGLKRSLGHLWVHPCPVLNKRCQQSC